MAGAGFEFASERTDLDPGERRAGDSRQVGGDVAQIFTRVSLGLTAVSCRLNDRTRNKSLRAHYTLKRNHLMVLPDPTSHTPSADRGADRPRQKADRPSHDQPAPESDPDSCETGAPEDRNDTMGRSTPEQSVMPSLPSTSGGVPAQHTTGMVANVWGSSSLTSTEQRQTGRPGGGGGALDKGSVGTATPSLSMIMAEQAEQEKILSAIQHRQRKQEQERRLKAEEDEALLRKIMEMSLEESDVRHNQDPASDDMAARTVPRSNSRTIAVPDSVPAAPDLCSPLISSSRSYGSNSEKSPSILPPLAPAESPMSASARSYGTDHSFSQRALRENERTDTLVLTPRSAGQEIQRRSFSTPTSSGQGKKIVSTPGASAVRVASRSAMMESAKQHLSSRELEEIQQALDAADKDESSRKMAYVPNLNDREEKKMASYSNYVGSSVSSPNPAASDPAMPDDNVQSFISPDEAAAIEAALLEADMKEHEESVRLAMQIQQEEMDREAALRLSLTNGDYSDSARPVAPKQQQGNVRTMTRAQLNQESERIGAVYAPSPPARHPLDNQDMLDDPVRATASARAQWNESEGYDDDDEAAGFRMNATSGQQQWNRRDRNTIVGPNNEVRTKHDVHVHNQSNAQRLALDADEFGHRANVGNRAFNSFQSNMKKSQGQTKGVATHGTGRGGSDADATKGKALDSSVRLEISRAINNGLIEKMNGVVKQGKEAVVYHATKGIESEGFDVAVKVFKKITEFRNRGEYVVGDPRYAGRGFRNVGSHDQLVIWTEKEYRNLVRANRARVPVPTPLEYKDNILFMRFLGDDGWPAPQLREIELRPGSNKWTVLYNQVMESIRRLYVNARLVHGDLSEYNILVAPASYVQNHSSSIEDVALDLQTVFIDFGQAVDIRHPGSESLLLRDLGSIRKFFTQKGVACMPIHESIKMVTADVEPDEVGASYGAPLGTPGSASKRPGIMGSPGTPGSISRKKHPPPTAPGTPGALSKMKQFISSPGTPRSASQKQVAAAPGTSGSLSRKKPMS